MDYAAAAKRLWELLDREHDGNAIVKPELGAMEWNELPPDVRNMLVVVARTFLDRTMQAQPKPVHRMPDFDALAVEAMVRAERFNSIPQWLAETIAAAYRMGRNSR